MGFETKTEITTSVGGEVIVRDIIKRPLFLPDDDTASDSRGGGVCVTCGRMTDCPICDVEPGGVGWGGQGDPNRNQQCLKNWTLFVKGGSGAGPDPDYDGGTIRSTVQVSIDDAVSLSGGFGQYGTWESQELFWPKVNTTQPGPFTGTMINYGSSSCSLRFGRAKYTTDNRTGRKTYGPRQTQFEGFGVTCVLTRLAQFDEICVDRPYNPWIAWPYVDAWRYPCSYPPKNMTQWLYAVSLNSYPTDFSNCYKRRGYRINCERWDERQVLIYHSSVSAKGLAKKIRCQDFAGIELGLVASSDQSWGGPYRRYKSVFDYTQEREPGGLHPRMKAYFPADYCEWQGGKPSITIYPSENEIYKPAESQRSRAGMTGTGTVT